jgi:hypothetical protein
MKWLTGLLVFAMTCHAALACDTPGTPDKVTVQALYSDVVEVSWANTAREGSDTNMWFMIEESDGTVTRVDMGNINYGQRAITVVEGLAPNKNHCLRVWARDDNIKGCRSKVPSAYVCAFTDPKLGPMPPPPRTMPGGPISGCVMLQSGAVSGGGPNPCN